MGNGIILLLIVFIPVFFAFVLPIIGRFSTRFRNILALVLVLISLFLSLISLPYVLSGKTIIIKKVLPLGFNFVFIADMLGVFMAIVSSFISSIIILYSFGYISHYENQNEYYFMVVLFLGSMMGLVFSGNLIFLYVFWEITAITSWRLIGFYREKQHVQRADKAFLITVFGALVMLIGFIKLYEETGSFDLLTIKENIKIQQVSNMTILLILAGMFSKSATLPFQTWLPDAGIAPSPVTALLHAAVLVKIGVYVFARLFIVTIPLGEFVRIIVLVIAGISALVSAGAAFIDTDLKRIIAYSTISQIAFIFLGLATGNEIGIAGGLLFILMHGLSKAGLFLCAGIVEHNAKTKDITQLGGLISTMPLTALSFLLCSFSVMGIPPFGGFFSKHMVFSGALKGNYFLITLVFLLGAFMTILYLFRAFNSVFMGEPKIPLVKEKSPVMVICVVLLAVFSLIIGIFVRYPDMFAHMTVQQMMVR